MLPHDQSFIQRPKFSILYNLNCITLLLCMSLSNLSTENIFFLAFLLNLILQTARLCHLRAFYPTVTYTPYLLYLSSLHVFFVFFLPRHRNFSEFVLPPLKCLLLICGSINCTARAINYSQFVQRQNRTETRGALILW